MISILQYDKRIKIEGGKTHQHFGIDSPKENEELIKIIFRVILAKFLTIRSKLFNSYKRNIQLIKK